MLYQCSEGGAIQIPTKFFFYLSNYELSCRCLEGGVKGSAIDPFTDSYLLNGEDERSEDEIEDEEEPDMSVDTDYSLSGLDED